jgi:hypothetical protein
MTAEKPTSFIWLYSGIFSMFDYLLLSGRSGVSPSSEISLSSNCTFRSVFIGLS